MPDYRKVKDAIHPRKDKEVPNLIYIDTDASGWNGRRNSFSRPNGMGLKLESSDRYLEANVRLKMGTSDAKVMNRMPRQRHSRDPTK